MNLRVLLKELLEHGQGHCMLIAALILQAFCKILAKKAAFKFVGIA